MIEQQFKQFYKCASGDNFKKALRHRSTYKKKFSLFLFPSMNAGLVAKDRQAKMVT
jgi:hypothetical protein